jgi:drug/metabolite transporter (DMT)-like permease
MKNVYLALPLLGAMLFAASALTMKAAAARRQSVTATLLLANLGAAIGFSVFVDWSAHPFLPERFWPPVLLGGIFFLGQLFSVSAISRGAASIATPIMSSKVVFVAFLVAFYIDAPVGWKIWTAGGLVIAGIALIQFSGLPEGTGKVYFAVVCAFLAALMFAVFDVLTQIYSQQMQFHRVLPFAMYFCLLLSLIVLPFIDRTAVTTRPSGLLLLSVVLMTLSSMLIVTAIGYFGDASRNNIVYGSRGIWSIAFAAVAGRWLGIAEITSREFLMYRLAGAVLILLAIGLVL